MTEKTKGEFPTREELIDICERGVVPVGAWRNRDTPDAQAQLGHCWALLRAGCDFTVEGFVEADRTCWVKVKHPTFGTFDCGLPHGDTTFYLPIPDRIQPGKDWY